MDHRFQYLRDHKGQPVGCVAIKLDKKEDSTFVTFQLSVLNPLDRFDRSLARRIAVGRLSTAPKMVMLVNISDPSIHEVTSAVMSYIGMGRDVPARAAKAAKLWLKNQDTWAI